MNNIHLICNPTSGKGSAAKTLEQIKEWLKFQKNVLVNIHITENVGHAVIISKELTSQNKPVTILVLGGDGTINEVLNGIENFDLTTIGILPFGSGNDFAKAVKYDKNEPIAMLNEYLYNPTYKKVDYMLINDKYRAINSIGLGMSADTIYNRDKMKHFKPRTQYILSVLKCGLFWKNFDVNFVADNKPEENIKTMWLTIMNGSTIGSSYLIDKDAELNDGQIQVMYLTNVKHIQTLSIISKVKKGKIDTVKQHNAFKCKEITIKVNDRAVEYDGHLLAHQDTINVKVVPGKINLLVC